MKKTLLLLIFVMCMCVSSTNAINATNNKQDPKKEKVKGILVSGIVKDEQGNRLKSVIIMVVRESESDISFGVESGEDGKYMILTKNNGTLMFSLNGYESQKISIKGRDEIDVVMKKQKSNF